MLLRQLALFPLMLCVPLLAVADEPDTPRFVQAAVERLASGDALVISRDWPRTSGVPEVCHELYLKVPSPQDGVMDGNRAGLLADVERLVLWIELARGLDDVRFYRGPVRLTEDSEFEVVNPASLPACVVTKPPDAA